MLELIDAELGEAGPKALTAGMQPIRCTPAARPNDRWNAAAARTTPRPARP